MALLLELAVGGEALPLDLPLELEPRELLLALALRLVARLHGAEDRLVLDVDVLHVDRHDLDAPAVGPLARHDARDLLAERLGDPVLPVAQALLELHVRDEPLHARAAEVRDHARELGLGLLARLEVDEPAGLHRVGDPVDDHAAHAHVDVVERDLVRLEDHFLERRRHDRHGVGRPLPDPRSLAAPPLVELAPAVDREELARPRGDEAPRPGRRDRGVGGQLVLVLVEDLRVAHLLLLVPALRDRERGGADFLSDSRSRARCRSRAGFARRAPARRDLNRASARAQRGHAKTASAMLAPKAATAGRFV